MMLRTSIRSVLTVLSTLAAAQPIETITATFVIVTLTYFQLLHAVKGSEFFQVPASAISPSPRPLHLLRVSHPQIDEPSYVLPSPPSPLFNTFTNSNEWAPVSVSEFRRILEANALEGGYVVSEQDGGNINGDKAAVVLVKQLTVVREGPPGSMDEWAHWLTNDFGVELGGEKYTYQHLCFPSRCHPEVTPHPLHSSQSTLTLYLQPPTGDTPTLPYLNHLARLPSHTSGNAGTNVTFRLLPPSTSNSWLLPTFDGAGLFAGMSDGASEKEEEELLSGLRNVRWFAYAARAFVMRFYALAKNADSADIFVVLLGYILMHGTFVMLFFNTRKIGSSFWLRESRSNGRSWLTQQHSSPSYRRSSPSSRPCWRRTCSMSRSIRCPYRKHCLFW